MIKKSNNKNNSKKLSKILNTPKIFYNLNSKSFNNKNLNISHLNKIFKTSINNSSKKSKKLNNLSNSEIMIFK